MAKNDEKTVFATFAYRPHVIKCLLFDNPAMMKELEKLGLVEEGFSKREY